PHVPSPTSSTELYSVQIKSQKVKTNRITGQPTGTGRAPLIEEHLLSKEAGPPLSSIRFSVPWLVVKWSKPGDGGQGSDEISARAGVQAVPTRVRGGEGGWLSLLRQ
ncbi:hypothetical protein, partial [Accumulibacter sp.]|uniref:hypothetical protein n=1 Tax=Accumulibacter sp. TaxID=2053492 RepID=UPI0035ADDFE6